LRRIASGRHLTRDSLALIDSAGFDIERLETISSGRSRMGRVQQLGRGGRQLKR
jgi:hypothetical protein